MFMDILWKMIIASHQVMVRNIKKKELYQWLDWAEHITLDSGN